MPSEIYNEGRVVGLSAWEIFFRDAVSGGTDPEDVPSEREWLASMFGNGAAMILKVPSGTLAGSHDYALPSASDLFGAGVIVATPFLGTCEFDTSGWAKKVTSYGPILPNTTTSHPDGSGNLPTPGDYPDDFAEAITDYLKITDGIVCTKGAEWIQNATGSPYSDINFKVAGTTTIIRLNIKDTLTTDIYILFTGFLNKSIMSIYSGCAQDDGTGHSIGGSTDTLNNNWKDGGMLGPEIAPWAASIIFTLPSYLCGKPMEVSRTLPKGISQSTVTKYGYSLSNLQATQLETNSYLDFNSINLTDYYTVNTFSGVPTITQTVANISSLNGKEINELIAWYPGMSASAISGSTSADEFFPPALYAAKVSVAGDKLLIPVDTAAPGTLKVFTNSTLAEAYITKVPDNYAAYTVSATNTFAFRADSLSDTSYTTTANYATDKPCTKLGIGNTTTWTLNLYNPDAEDWYNLDGTDQTTQLMREGQLTWTALLTALSSGASIDVLGKRLQVYPHTIGTDTTPVSLVGLPSTEELTPSGAPSDSGIDYIGARWLVLNPSGDPDSDWVKDDTVWLGTYYVPEESLGDGVRYLDLGWSGSPASIKLGTNFIRFGNGLKLFISNTEPSTDNVPVGSIGIGW